MVVANSNSQFVSSRRTPMELTLRQSTPRRWQGLPASGLRWDVGTVVVKTLLDHISDELKNSAEVARSAMSELFAGLYSLRSSATPEVWKSIVEQCVNHPILELIHEDPFTSRSFRKPRGYAGDAQLIDYIYTRSPRLMVDQPVTPLGEMIFGFTTEAPASAGVRTRRDLMASFIDETCATTDQAHILSVACGHLGEAKLSRAVVDGCLGQFVALDQDELSIGVVRETLSGLGIVPVCGSIKAVFRGELANEKFDLIYSTGLYDYLDQRIAMRLTSRLFDMLNPGGRLVIANFLPDIWCAGFMETYMGWSLIYRNSEQMIGLTNTISGEDLATRRTFYEKNANIVFLDVRRR